MVESTGKPSRYAVLGFIPKSALTPAERALLAPRSPGLWVPVRTIAAWSSRGAVKKLLDQGWSPDSRMVRFKGELEGNGPLSRAVAKPRQMTLFPEE